MHAILVWNQNLSRGQTEEGSIHLWGRKYIQNKKLKQELEGFQISLSGHGSASNIRKMQNVECLHIIFLKIFFPQIINTLTLSYFAEKHFGKTGLHGQVSISIKKPHERHLFLFFSSPFSYLVFL